MLTKNAEPYAPMMSTMVPLMAARVILITGSLDVEHRARYSRHSDILDSGVVSLNRIWLMYDSFAGHSDASR
jgi:hypothetical protein